MQDVQLYEQLLELEAPWKVEAVSLKVAEQEIEVRVRCRETVWGCPECSQRMHVHGWEERRWRHLDSCQFKTMIGKGQWGRIYILDIFRRSRRTNRSFATSVASPMRNRRIPCAAA